MQPSSNSKPIPIRGGKSGNVVGNVHNGIFIKRLQASKHQFRSRCGWAQDKNVLYSARAAGATTVAIHETENKEVWTAPLSNYFEHGEPLNYGHGLQVLLGCEYWNVQPMGHTPKRQNKNAPPPKNQLSLFDGTTGTTDTDA